MWRRLLMAGVCLVLVAQPAPAGLFHKTVKPDPAQRVPELLKTLREDRDDHKRADAAEALRDYEPKAFPEIMPALIDALQNDPSSNVRAQAANSIGRLRPISQQAGYALEQAYLNDSSMRVRVAARTTLWEYHLLGYRSGNSRGQHAEQTDEPPLADPPGASATPQPKQSNQKGPMKGAASPPAPPTRPHFPIFFPRKDHRGQQGAGKGEPSGPPPAVSPNTEPPPLPPFPRRPVREADDPVSGPTLPAPPKPVSAAPAI